MNNHHHHRRHRGNGNLTAPPPWVIRSNSAYEIDDYSSTASSISGDAATSEEELRLREELAIEVEKEVERELMEGIVTLVRRLSDLRARQIVRAVREANRRPWGGDEFEIVERRRRGVGRNRKAVVVKGAAAKRAASGGGGSDSQVSDESRGSGVKCCGQNWGRK